MVKLCFYSNLNSFKLYFDYFDEINLYLSNFVFSNLNAAGAMNCSNAGGNSGGGELFEKFQRQKMNRESSVYAGVLTDT